LLTLFLNNRYTKNIEAEVKEWVANNIDRWSLEKPDWYHVELIPDEFLPKEVFEAEGGVNRKRESQRASPARVLRVSVASATGRKSRESQTNNFLAMTAELRYKFNVVDEEMDIRLTLRAKKMSTVHPEA